MYRLIMILISLVSVDSFAANAGDLYQSQMQVATQAEDERKNVAPEILKAVLLKVVGDSEALNSTDISAILAKSESYIQQYQYHRLNKISDDLTLPDQLALQLDFNEQAVNQALTDLNLPVWGRVRPDILLWLAIDDNGSRAIVNSDYAENSVAIGIQALFAERGVSSLMPLMDLEDQSQLSFADLWAGFPDPILAASQRYAAKVVVMARVSIDENNAMQIRWQSLTNGESEQWQSKGSSEKAVQAGGSELVDRLARRFASKVRSLNIQEHDVVISNVSGYADYARIRDYLMALNYVSDVQLSNLVSEQLEITISLSSEISVLNQTIAIDHVLAEDVSYTRDDLKRYRLLK